MAKLRTCETCHYFQYLLDRSECRFNPPQTLPLQLPGVRPGEVQLQIQAFFPPTKADSWCGKYEEKRTATETGH